MLCVVLIVRSLPLQLRGAKHISALRCLLLRDVDKVREIDLIPRPQCVDDVERAVLGRVLLLNPLLSCRQRRVDPLQRRVRAKVIFLEVLCLEGVFPCLRPFIHALVRQTRCQRVPVRFDLRVQPGHDSVLHALSVNRWLRELPFVQSSACCQRLVDVAQALAGSAEQPERQRVGLLELFLLDRGQGLRRRPAIVRPGIRIFGVFQRPVRGVLVNAVCGGSCARGFEVALSSRLSGAFVIRGFRGTFSAHGLFLSI